jgi:hypothetical protein
MGMRWRPFGRRTSEDLATALREESARVRGMVESALSEMVRLVSAQAELQREWTASVAGALEMLGRDALDRSAGAAEEVVRVAQALERTGERLLARTADHSALLEALVPLVGLAPDPGDRRPTVTGGTVSPGTGPPQLALDGEEPRHPVEVKSRFGDRWIPGFEIVDVALEADGTVSYGLRRRIDGAVLPVRFRGDDVRRLPVPIDGSGDPLVG